ncbi:MAG: ABC transporter substrate-binding protein [Lachnospiraceae bacterium]|nr:ABC transporter substrate-binding protein [Lachnospiraceae bacterium]
MKAKKVRKTMAAALMALGVCGLATGCGTSTVSKDYDLYIYNTKSEIADSIQDLCEIYEEETGVRVKVYTCGTTEAMETLRSEITSSNYPTVFSINQSTLTEWYEGGYLLEASEMSNEELQAIYDSIPEEMRLQDEDGGNYGIPYNIEGYGLIADTQMICDVFGLEAADDFIEDFRLADYEEFAALVVAIDDYINGNGGETISLNGNTYTTATEKTDATSALNGVFAIAGAEKWTYGNHYVNYALNAVFSNYCATDNATAEQLDELEEPLVKLLSELDFLTGYTAGGSGSVSRGSEYINSTITGYDQAVQTFAEGKAMFIKQGNWIYSTVEDVDAEKAGRLVMLPMKVNFEESDITAEGVTVEKMNTSIPEFVSQYYVVNAKATEEEQEIAEAFLVWLYTSETGTDYIVNQFAFVPFNADESVELDNPLSNDLIYYMQNDLVLGNDFDAVPNSWGTEVIGAFIQEDLFTDADAWEEDVIRSGVQSAISTWKGYLS